MRRLDAGEIAQRLGREAEAVCRRYLSRGRRKGRYWLVGDVHNMPGRSLFVRLTGPASGKGAAGRCTDAATGQHGDLLDLIGHTLGTNEFAAVLDEACAFLSLPRPEPAATPPRSCKSAANPTGSPDAARRLFAMASPIGGTLAETYLHGRGLQALHDTAALRFHPRCLYRPEPQAPSQAWPALIAAVTDLSGALTGVQRTWLAPDGSGKAPLDTPRRALGSLLGHAVRFGRADDVMAAGEGLETVLSLRQALPDLPMAAALSAGNLAALLLPTTLRRLYIARDNDPAGHHAAAALVDRARLAGIEPVLLRPRGKDFNDGLRAIGAEALCAQLRIQLMPEDVARFMPQA